MELYNEEFVYYDWDDKLEGKKGFFGDSINHIKQNVKDNRTMWFGEICHNVNMNTDYPFGFIDGYGNSHRFRFCYYDPYYEFRKAYIEGKQLQFKNHEGDWEDVLGAPLFTSDEYRVKPEYRIKPEWYVVLDDYGLSRTNEPSENETVLSKGTEEECIQWLDEYRKFEKILLAWRQGRTIQYKENNEWIDWVLSEIPRKDAFDTLKEWRIKDECKGCMKYNYCTNKNGIRCRNYCTEVTNYVPFDTVQELVDAWDKKYPQNKNRPEGTMPLIWIKNKQKNRVYLITDFLFDKYFNNDVGTEDENLQLKELFERFTFLDGSIIGKLVLHF
jgi:hypothetical protein